MSIDEGDTADTTSTTDANTEPADTAADLASQDSSTQVADESSSAAPEADQQANEGASSTTLDTTLQTADQQAGNAEPKDWAAERAKYEKRVADLRAAQGRTANELHQYRQRYKDIDPDAARKAMALAKQPEYQPWNPKSGQHRSFMEAKAAFTRYEMAIQRAKTPEAKQALIDTLGSTFSQEEARMIEAWKLHQQQDAERRASDPEYEREARREEIREEMRQELQAQREEAAVADWFSNADNQTVVERYRDEMIGLMNEGWHWPQVQRYIEAKAKADGLQSRVGGAEVKAAAARAQQAALKTNAKASRDPAQAPVGKLDFAKIGADFAKKQGLPINHERVLAHVEKAVANWRASQPNQ